MASSSSQKRRERSPTPSEGEGSSAVSAQGKVQKVVDRLAFPLRDPWYTPNLFFSQESHGEALFSPRTWEFFGQLGFASFA